MQKKKTCVNFQKNAFGVNKESFTFVWKKSTVYPATKQYENSL